MPKPKLAFIGNYRKGLYYLAVALAVLMLLSWFMNIKPTYVLWKANKKYRADLLRADNATSEIADLERQLESLERVAIKSHDRDMLLQSVTSFCKDKGMLIRNFPATERNREKGVVYLTNLIEVEGEYKDIVRLAYMLEHERMLGSIASLKFNAVEDRVEKKTRLRGSIILRNMES